MNLQVGQTIDRYKVLSLLGEGGMASVYLVEHDRLATRHALKVLNVTHRDVQRRTVQEGRMQASLRHPNIVSVTDVLELDGTPALLMEYIEGPSLDAWLRGYRPRLDEALRLFRGVLAGVKHAHDLGLIHRDLKPANVLLQPTPEGIVPKVADFGLAKAIGGAANLQRTRTGATLGTPAFMAPEQIRDASTVDARADVYSLGCILYELVCGCPPYEATDMLALFAAVSAGSYTPPDRHVPDLPGAVRDAIDGCLRTDPGRRIADCDVLAEVLYGIQKGDPFRPLAGVTITPDSTGAYVLQEMIRSRGSAPPAGSNPGSNAGTWADMGTGELPAAASAAAAPRPAGSITTLRPAQPSIAPASPWPLRIAVVVSIVAVLLGGGGLIFGVGAAAFAAWFSAPGAATDVRPVIIERPAHVEAPTGADPVAPDPAPGAADPQRLPKPKPAAPSVAPPPTVEVVEAPVVEPTPPEVRVVVVPPPKAEPTPPPPPAGATFTFVGADEVVLIGADGATYAAGQPVPPGSYQVRARFDGGAELVGAGRVNLADAAPFAFRCNAAMAQCKKS